MKPWLGEEEMVKHEGCYYKRMVSQRTKGGGV